jgi:hypothetical protein
MAADLVGGLLNAYWMKGGMGWNFHTTKANLNVTSHSITIK